MEDIAQTIKTLRKRAGLSQAELATILGTSQAKVSRWESGIYMPPADALLKLQSMCTVNKLDSNFPSLKILIDALKAKKFSTAIGALNDLKAEIVKAKDQ